ncbi:MAG: hypothetical protein K0V04_04500 [Deltaproteobacteria bacterium]|nr:hypothetical protein [Deltaproteobacteria bacterium]
MLPDAAFAKIGDRLRDDPRVELTQAANALTIVPRAPNSFAVTLQLARDRSAVYFDGWHEEFDAVEPALECAGYGLTRGCRLRVDSRGTTPYRWTLEMRCGSEWTADSATGLLLAPWWRRRTTRYLYNDVLPDRDAEPALD